MAHATAATFLSPSTGCRVPAKFPRAPAAARSAREIAGRLSAIVTVNTFDGVDASLLRRSSADFDGEGADSRLERRARNWIGRVQFVEQQR